ncbi:hypothetical protein SPPR111872_25180 [Sphingobacterium prati]
MNGNLLSIRKEISWEKEEIKIDSSFRLEKASCQQNWQGAFSVNRLPLKNVLSRKLSCVVCKLDSSRVIFVVMIGVNLQ